MEAREIRLALLFVRIEQDSRLAGPGGDLEVSMQKARQQRGLNRK